jgi:hypothetical protein
MTGWATIEELCDRYLGGGRPSPASLEQLKKAEGEPPEIAASIERAFRLMEMSRFRAQDISLGLAWGLSVFVPYLHHAQSQGIIPPATFQDRHKRIEAYLVNNPWAEFGPGTTLLEMGCGFPPQTAIDAARAHPEWEVTGADPCFDEYLLYDEKGDYACIDRKGEIRFFGSKAADFGAMLSLYQDQPETLRRLYDLFGRLRTNFRNQRTVNWCVAKKAALACSATRSNSSNCPI